MSETYVKPLSWTAPKNGVLPSGQSVMPMPSPGTSVSARSLETKRTLLAQALQQQTAGPKSCPISFAQQRLWFLEQLEPNTPVYNVPLGLHLRGRLNAEALQSAIERVVDRHEALRTNFVSPGGAPVQVIRGPAPVPLPLVDWSESAGRTLQDLIPRLLEEARRPFHLAEDSLIRAILFRLGQQEHVLLFNLHHIICDEWSLRVLLRELASLYGAFSEGRKEPLPDLRLQYADYTLWQRDWLRGPALAEQLNYWRQRLAGTGPDLELPKDFSRRSQPVHQGAREHLEIPRDMSERLRGFSRQHGVTLFMTLLAVFKTLLHRYTGQAGITVGSPVAGRSRVETEELIGFFVNTLVLRTDLTGDPGFVELLKRVRETTLGAFEHQDLPFDQLVEQLHPERSGSQTPYLQAVFSLEHALDEEIHLPGLEVKVLELDTSTAKFELTWVVRESASGLRVCVEYATALFQPATIRRMLGHWQRLLESAVTNPTQPISQLSLISLDEKQRAVVEWNQTARVYSSHQTLAALFEEQAQHRPKAVAVRYGGVELTYWELNRRANRVAHLLRRYGVGPEQVVGLFLDRSAELVVAMLGIIKAGGAYLPLDSSYPPERMKVMLKDAGVSVLLSHAPLHSQSSALGVPTTLNLESLPASSDADPPPQGAPDSLAYVIYTSGSTGRPKGVLVPQRAVVQLVHQTDYVQLTPGDRVAQASNACFDAATFEIWGALLNGATLIGFSRDVMLSPQDLATELNRNRITTLFLTTALFNQLAARVPDAFRSIKHLLFGGEAVDAHWVREILRHQAPERLLHVYGPTETTTFASWYWIKEVPPGARTIPIGRPIAHTTLYLLDRHLQPVPVGVPGEVFIGGRGVARGYLNDPELTAEKFIPDPFQGEPGARLYRTGDRGRYRPDGNIEFLGRSDQQVKIRGFRVELEEIESVLATHPAVQASVVVAQQADSTAGKRLVAYVVTRPGSGPNVVDGLRRFLKDKLPGYMVPAAFIPLSHLPLNANGKIDRAALPAPERAEAGPARGLLPPSSPEEQKLAGIWREVLHLDQVGVQDDFFELGGHSLLAVQLFDRIEKEFGIRLPLASLFQSPTIAQLAGLFRPGQAATPSSLFVEIQSQGAKPPFFWVHSLGGDGGGAFFYYRKLAQLLGPDQPSIGIRSPPEPFSRIEEMAAHYVDELLRFQSQETYFLGGFCFGGIVAFEMARQLQARGREVGLLVLLESVPPGCLSRQWSWRSATALAENLQSWVGDVLRQKPDELWARAQRKARSVQKRLRQALAGRQQPSGTPDLGDLIDMSDYPKDYIRYAQVHWQALQAYKPQPFSGHITLFRARKQPLLCLDPTLGWAALAQQGVAVNVIPGTHEKMLAEPNVQILAAELKLCLVEAQSPTAELAGAELEAEEEEPENRTARSGPCSIIT